MFVRPISHSFRMIKHLSTNTPCINKCFIMICVVMCSLCSACEVHDYWMMPSSLKVDSEQDIYYSELDEPLKDDLFMRYQLDYAIINESSSNPSEVVVIGTSYVNSFERAVGLKVWHLEPEEIQDGILMSTQLQYGNALNISLACCNKSECNRRDVLCPEEDSDATQIASFCYSACQDRTPCIDKCPATAACEQHCKESSPAELNQCMLDTCTTPGKVNSCKQICNDDDACYDTCEPYSGCVDKCTSNSAACFKNCLSTWSQCTDDIYVSDDIYIPCSLCSGSDDEQCLFNVSKDDEPVLTSVSGNQYPCSVDCSAYPASCVTGCETLYEDDSSRMDCLDNCLIQHLYWCNDFIIPTDYVDTSVTQPCCFSDFCQAEFQGIVKTFEVQCFNDSSCSSNHYCSDEGVCVASGSGGCSTTTLRRPPYSIKFAALFIGLLVSLYTIRRRRHSL